MHRDIWVLSATGWSLPLSVEWPDGQTEVCALRIGGGIRLLDIQRSAAIERLTELGAYFHNGRYMLGRATLERFCTREGQVDPQTVVEWRPPSRIKYRNIGRKSAQYRNQDEFFHEFAKAGWTKTSYSAEVLWLAFCKHILHWLVNENKPVNLGFCELIPVPLRANWKALLLSKYVKGRTKLREVSPRRLTENVAERLLFSPEFTAWRDDKRIYWTLEVLPLKGWFRAMIARERERRRRLSRRLDMYCYSVRQAIKRALPNVIKLYATYVSQTRRPSAYLTEKHIPADQIPGPPRNIKGQFVRVNPPRVVPHKYDAWAGKAVPPVQLPNPDPAHNDLPGVPDLRSGEPDVRQSTEALDQSQNGEGKRDHGVPLPDGREGAC